MLKTGCKIILLSVFVFSSSLALSQGNDNETHLCPGSVSWGDTASWSSSPNNKLVCGDSSDPKVTYYNVYPKQNEGWVFDASKKTASCVAGGVHAYSFYTVPAGVMPSHKNTQD